MPIRALFIDIDDTLIVSTNGHAPWQAFQPESMFSVLEAAALELGGLSRIEARRRIDYVTHEVAWWHWSDFIVALDLEPADFWEFAYQQHRTHYGPSGPELTSALHALKAAGFMLFVTSNNPSSGILHKLRLAGLGTIHGAPLFTQLLGATEMHAMKSDPIYWRKALAHTGLRAREVAVVGDDLHDDWEIPHSTGIPLTFLLDRQSPELPERQPSLLPIRSLHEILAVLESVDQSAYLTPR